MEPIDFKFRFVNATGHETGFLNSLGSLDEEELVLGKTVIPIASIFQAPRRYERLAIVYQSDVGPVTQTIAIRSGLARKIKQAIDRLCSYRWAQERRAQLAREGKEGAFRTARCWTCTAVVDLSGFEETPEFYCPFCESVQELEHAQEDAMERYRLCDRCGFYSRPTRFTTAYVILNFISWRNHHSCHACMRRECLKMLLGNLLPPFFGSVLAIIHAIRAYSGKSVDTLFPELVRANCYAGKARFEEARELYEKMLDRVRVQAGLRYNIALTYALANDWEKTLGNARAALRDCSNYHPAGTLVGQALAGLGRSIKSEQYLASWGMPADDLSGQHPAPPGSDGIQHLPQRRSSDAIRGLE